MVSLVAHRFSCSMLCEIFLDQRLNPCLLHWQANSLPLSPQGSLSIILLIDEEDLEDDRDGEDIQH